MDRKAQTAKPTANGLMLATHYMDDGWPAEAQQKLNQGHQTSNPGMLMLERHCKNDGLQKKKHNQNTHARTAPPARLRAKALSADALVAASARTVSPWRVEQPLFCRLSPSAGQQHFPTTDSP